MRKVTFQIKKTKVDGGVFFQVTTPNPEGGRPKRKAFKNRGEAETYLQSVKIQSENYGAAAFGISDTLRTDAIRAAEILRETGVTLTESARFYLQRWSERKRGVPIKDAVQAFLEARANREKRHRANMKARLGHFAAAAESKTTADVTAEDVSGFLDSLVLEQRTILHYWTHLSGFFNFCMKKGWRLDNPMRQVDRPRVAAHDVEMLTPKQATDLLVACDDRILAGVAIGLFCGLRQCEIEGLDWSATDLVEGVIRISAAQAGKQTGRRMVPIPDCAKAWLTPLRQPKGKVWPQGESTRDSWTQARIKAGFGPFAKPTSSKARELQTDPKTGKQRKDLVPWPDNALRHSAISYKLALSGNMGVIAYESGNSTNRVRDYYNGLATAKEATAYFSILPKESGNIIHMEAVA